MAVIILASGSQSYPGVAPTSQKYFGVMEVRLSVSIPFSPSWILPDGILKLQLVIMKIFILVV
jgi:hypothetical protein